MKYMFLLFDVENEFHDLTEDEQMKIIGEYGAFSEALLGAGAMIEGEPLDHTRNAKRIRGGRIEDGPFTDAKEQLGGYYVVEAKDLDAALDWAARCPAATYGFVEVRPLQLSE